MRSSDLRTVTASNDGPATVVVDPDRTGDPVDERLFGKFAEHLGRNVDGGMSAQILVNPTFGPWEFVADDNHPDGGIQPVYRAESIRDGVREYCEEWSIPNATELYEAYQHGTAFGWAPTDGVRTTPDTGPAGDRAQRLVLDERGGTYQHTHLPRHRTNTYEVDGYLRATEPTTVTIGVYPPEADPRTAEPLGTIERTVDRDWQQIDGTLRIDGDGPADAAYVVAITARAGSDLVIDRLTLYPDDHVHGADPEVVEYLRDADLPLLRWPGGNFVSGYQWRDAVGPLADRPARVNPAWGHVEPNLFGTAEFIDFCAAVGCEPLLCVNAGDGTPEEAARWVEYCNGSVDTEMGGLRAEHGHPEPFDVEYWEVGNELFGRWQVNWTTPSGNADRFRRFRDAMLEVDPDLTLLGCGNRNSPADRWNEQLLDAIDADRATITDHVLSGGTVHEGVDPDELFAGLMGYAEQLGEEYRDLREKMIENGIEEPRLAITELQLFAHFETNREIGHHGEKLDADRLPARTTIAEPLYFGTILHEAIRLGEFVQMITHSATVNHGGGLQKHRERTWADPAHYGHVLLSALEGGVPLGVDISCASISTERSFGDIEAFDSRPAIDAMAVEQDDHLVVSLLNRQRRTDVDLELDVSTLSPFESATVSTLTAEAMHVSNTFERPEQVTPTSENLTVDDGLVKLSVPSCGLQRVVIE